MARFRRNKLVGEILARDNTAGLPLWDHAVAATAPRKVPTGDGTRNASYAKTIEEGITESQQEVLNALRTLGSASDRDVRQFTGLDINIVTARRNDLVDLGLVTDDGKKFDSDTRRHVTLWRAT